MRNLICWLAGKYGLRCVSDTAHLVALPPRVRELIPVLILAVAGLEARKPQAGYGEFKRAHLFGAALKNCPRDDKMDIALALELAVREVIRRERWH